MLASIYQPVPGTSSWGSYATFSDMMGDARVFGCLVALPIAIAGVVFWCWMLLDCATHEHGTSKFWWLIVLLLPHGAGLLFYYFLRWRPRRRVELGLV